MEKPKNFEDATSQLEKLIQALEDGSMSLKDSVEAYKTGVELLNYCKHELDDAEQQINIVSTDSNGKTTIRPFESL